MNKKEFAKISISKEIMNQIEKHCFSEVGHEVGGFLVGTIDGDKTLIEGAIPSTKAQSQRTSLTFTHEAWDEAYQALATDFQDKSLVGWYHSHPGFGVFMSEYDSFIQQNFFGAEGQLALVVDPLAGRRGWFKWKSGKIRDINEEKTTKKALGGVAADYVPQAATTTATSVSSANFSITQIPVPQMIALFLLVALTGLVGFLSGKSMESPGAESAQAENVVLRNTNATLSQAILSPLFDAKQAADPKQGTVFVRYLPNTIERSQANWLNLIATRFGVTEGAIIESNPGLDPNAAPPNSLYIPVSGWTKPLPAATPTPSEE